eukprot:scaffold137207_cov39-Attheya_sp.AAC.1
MCAALNCPAWRLQNSLVAPRRLGDDEYLYRDGARSCVSGRVFPSHDERICWISSSEDGGAAGSELVGQ